MSDICIDRILSETAENLASCVAAAEDAYHQKIESVVRDLLSGGQRVIMLAGPSSSGKTTTANILADRLSTAGHSAAVVSLDNFYRQPDDPGYPRNPDGSLDFETVDALEIGAIHDCIAAVLRGGEYLLPRFDFKRGCRAEERIPLSVPEDGFVIVEGLHALNPVLTDGLSGLYRLFISVSTNVVDGEGNRLLSGRKIRFLRRMSRDFLYRNATAARTYELWQSVLPGEDKYLYPYRDRADRQLDTFHLYEGGVLRGYAEKLLFAPDAPQNPYVEEIRRGLTAFPVIDSAHVPNTSLLREFIPGGVYESLY